MNNCIKEEMSLSPEEMADEFSMTDKEYLLVEGQMDKKFWEHLQREGLNKRQIRVANKKQCSGNKEYVKKVISIMNQRKKQNAVGVIDLDYDLIRNNIADIENVYYYKFLDLENVLIQSNAFSEINNLISSQKKKLNDNELKKILYQKTYILGIIRLINEMEGYNFSFDKLDYKKLLSESNDDFLTYFMSKMELKKEEREQVSLQIQVLMKEEYEGEYLCNGHDLINILSQLTKKIISNDSPIQYNEEIIQNMLILSYRNEENASDVQMCKNILRI